MRRDVQVVFQDPMASLDPRMPVFDLIAEPMGVFKVEQAGDRAPGHRAAPAGRSRARARQPLSRSSSPAASDSASGSPGRWRSSRS